MEDSPLSIAANIAGLLTFVVAIFASIYVRVVSLRNGKVEMKTVLQCSVDNMQDLRESQADLSITEGDEPDIIWLKKLNASLFATEIVINVYCGRVMNADTTFLEDMLYSTQWVGITPTTFADAAQEIKATKKSKSVIRRLYGERAISSDTSRWSYFDQSVAALQVLFTAGSSPTLIRWYRVRERVLERVRQRDVLRSRLLSHQVYMANT